MKPLAFLLVLLAAPAAAQTTYTWIGGTGSWTAPSNWAPSGIPAASDTALVGSGAVTLDASADVAKFVLSGSAALTGSGTLTVTDSLVWLAGASGFSNMSGSGRTVVAEGAVFRVAGAGTHTLRDARALDLLGTTEWTSGRLSVAQGATTVITNAGLFEVSFDGVFGSDQLAQPGVFNNTGIIRKTGGTGALRFERQPRFNNGGSVEVLSGTLDIQSPGEDTGAYTVAEGATLAFTFLSRTLAASSSVSGAGDVMFGPSVGSAGPVSVQGAYTVTGATTIRNLTTAFETAATLPVLRLSGSGTLSGGGTVTVTDTLDWTVPANAFSNMRGSGRTVVAEGAVARIAGPGYHGLNDSRALDLLGTTTWSDGRLDVAQNATAILTNGGLFEVPFDGTFGSGQLSAPGRFRNEGTFRKSGGGGTLRMDRQPQFENAGTVEVLSGVLEVAAAGTSTGAFEIADGAALALAPVLAEYVLAPGSEVRGAGTLALDAPGPAVRNGAVVRPGLPLGRLTVEGAYPAPEAEGTLEVELAGLTPISEHDQLQVSGDALLAGALRLVFAGGFAPVVGDAFTVVTCGGACTGAFASVDAPPGYTFEVSYGAEEVVATVTAVTVTNEPEGDLPAAFALHTAYPNPAAGHAAFRYDVPAPTRVRLAVYDLLGREVAVVVDAERSAGRHEAVLDGRGLAAGTYLVRMTTGSGFAQIRAVTLLR